MKKSSLTSMTTLLTTRGKRTVILAGALCLAVALTSLPVAAGNAANLISGEWTGCSYDITYDIPGELTARFETRTSNNFDGTIFASYPDGTYQECTVTNGHIFRDGRLQMAVYCQFPTNAFVDTALISAQLDESNTLMNGTWHGFANEQGYFILEKGEYPSDCPLP